MGTPFIAPNNQVLFANLMTTLAWCAKYEPDIFIQAMNLDEDFKRYFANTFFDDGIEDLNQYVDAVRASTSPEQTARSEWAKRSTDATRYYVELSQEIREFLSTPESVVRLGGTALTDRDTALALAQVMLEISLDPQGFAEAAGEEVAREFLIDIKNGDLAGALGRLTPDIVDLLVATRGGFTTLRRISREGLPAFQRRVGAQIAAADTGPRLTIRDRYNHHRNIVNDITFQLERQGYRVSDREISFGSSCGKGRCRPDIVYETPDGKLGIIEVKTGKADLTIRQSEIFPQIEDGSSIPRGQVARDFGLMPGIPLREQGYPNGIPVRVEQFPGAGG